MYALPEHVKRLKDEDKNKYIKLMESEKKEKRYFVRIMIVGKERAGKTCLMKRLLNKRFNKNEPSTDGVEIVVQRCKINIHNGKWKINKNKADDVADRFQRAIFPNTNIENVTPIQNESILNQSSIEDESKGVSDNFRKQPSLVENQGDMNDTCTTTPSELASSKETIDDELKPGIETCGDDTLSSTESLVSRRETINELNTDETKDKTLLRTYTNNKTQSIEKIEKIATDNDSSKYLKENEDENKSSLLTMPEDLLARVLSKTSNSYIASNQHALCGLWDFAGQKEFYATHQAFLTSCAIYLVVADIDDDISKQDITQYFADYSEVGVKKHGAKAYAVSRKSSLYNPSLKSLEKLAYQGQVDARMGIITAAYTQQALGNVLNTLSENEVNLDKSIQVVRDIFAMSIKSLDQVVRAGAFHHLIRRKATLEDTGLNDIKELKHPLVSLPLTKSGVIGDNMEQTIDDNRCKIW
ncbi:Hypothetical predicted protein [Mytilus galloprovincialis]|uniref:Roc domain-containing protein n=1 Tax=Mytilus galloprovincialis TaxID=29158 RepID=A0A8B6BZJ5_MYTGA|nr:Hypothetical predicted protein [Mytilus galloprovincialis]